MTISADDLFLNSNGSIYHLNLLPEEIAPFIILVGDPGRVPLVSKYFDRIELTRQKREFVTHTGYLGGHRLSVISTGIGVGNIDIVMNEIDALFNINLQAREIKPNLQKLQILRLGTCGGLDPAIDIESVVAGNYAFAFDGLLNFYQQQFLKAEEIELKQALHEHFVNIPQRDNLYLAPASNKLLTYFDDLPQGLTLTCPGFYGAQARELRIPLIKHNLLDLAESFNFKNFKVANVEMETAAIYGLGKLLGHDCLSLSTVIDTRAGQKVSKNIPQAVTRMIEFVLDRLPRLNLV